MRRLLQMAAMAAVATPALAGSIILEAPVVSAEATAFQDQHEPTHRELSRAQLQAISAWLSWNREGWFGSKLKEPSDPVQIQLNLKHGDGTSSTLSVVSDAGRKHHLVFINQGAPAYSTWFGIVKAPAATRPLAEYELEALQRILGLR
jgi:hypothetical protein